MPTLAPLLQQMRFPASSFQRRKMLRVERSSNGEVIFRLSGRMHGENIVQLEELLKSVEKGRRITLDLQDLPLVGEDAVRFLSLC
jgi:anti-anti-sigma regulatory factor